MMRRGLAVGARGVLEVVTNFLTRFSEAPLRRWGPVRVQIPLRSGHQGCLCLCPPPSPGPNHFDDFSKSQSGEYWQMGRPVDQCGGACGVAPGRASLMGPLQRVGRGQNG